jgi:hypothetical protein
VSTDQNRDAKDTARLHDAHRKRKSMYTESAGCNYLTPSLDQSTSSRRGSLLSVAGSEASRSSDTLTIRPYGGTHEKMPPNSSSKRDMSQLQARPASTSISNSSRPSSLFWTATPEVNESTSTLRKQKSYGAIESTINQDDPYGYRALAGPALLPSYHEEQQKQQKLKEVNSRTCGPTIAVIQAKRWAIAMLLGLSIIMTGIIFVLL